MVSRVPPWHHGELGIGWKEGGSSPLVWMWVAGRPPPASSCTPPGRSAARPTSPAQHLQQASHFKVKNGEGWMECFINIPTLFLVMKPCTLVSAFLLSSSQTFGPLTSLSILAPGSTILGSETNTPSVFSAQRGDWIWLQSLEHSRRRISNFEEAANRGVPRRRLQPFFPLK